MKIFTFVLVEKKLPIYFPLFPSMIKSRIFTNSLTSLWRLVSEKAHRIWDVKSATSRLSVYKCFKTLCVLVSYSNLHVLGLMGHLRSTGLPGMKQMTKPSYIYARKLSFKIGRNFNVPRKTWGPVNKNPTWRIDFSLINEYSKME